MEPVTNHEQHFTVIAVSCHIALNPLLARGCQCLLNPMHNKAAKDSITPLDLRVCMPPKGPMLITPNLHMVRECLAGRDSTLGDADGAIKSVTPEKLEPVPMDSDPFTSSEVVLNLDDNLIA
jgi:hypothetical protein